MPTPHLRCGCYVKDVLTRPCHRPSAHVDWIGLDPQPGISSGFYFSRGAMTRRCASYAARSQYIRNDASVLWMMGFTLVVKGQPNEAIPLLEKAAVLADRSSGFINVLAAAYARAGRRSDALRILAELKKRKEQGYVAAASFAIVYLGLGENEEAFTWLGEAYKERSNILQFVKVHPFFDPLRGDRRFADLVYRVFLG